MSIAHVLEAFREEGEILTLAEIVVRVQAKYPRDRVTSIKQSANRAVWSKQLKRTAPGTYTTGTWF